MTSPHRPELLKSKKAWDGRDVSRVIPPPNGERSQGMGIWDGLPYELQSPRWRDHLNRADGQGSGYNPSLNQNFTTRFLDAQVAIARANASANGVNTTQVDGQTPFVNALSSLGGALVQSLGIRADAGTPQPVAQPVAFGMGGRQSSDMDMKTLLMIGGVGFAAFMIWGR